MGELLDLYDKDPAALRLLIAYLDARLDKFEVGLKMALQTAHVHIEAPVNTDGADCALNGGAPINSVSEAP